MVTLTECITSANNSMRKMGESLASAVQCDGIVGEDFAAIFEINTSNLQNAFVEFVNEKSRVNGEIENVNKHIDSAQTTINEYRKLIKKCDDTNFNAVLNTINNEMDSYRRDINKAITVQAKAEAESNYQSALRRKEEAEAAKRANDRIRKDYIDQKEAAEKKQSDYKAQKKDLEKRISDIDDILKMF